MTASTVHADNVVTKFLNKVRTEYVRKGKFGSYIGKDANSIIQTKQDLKKVSIPLVGKLTGNGVEGSGQLGGNEEALSNYACELTPTYKRHGVLVDNEENEKSEFQLFKEARPALMNWAMELKRDQIIQAFAAVEAGGTYLNYGDASAAQLDTWNTNNQDRVLYGSDVANNTSGDHTASLATIDATNDKLSAATISLLKRMAEAAAPLIRPVTINGDEEYFVFFCDSFGFRDLQADATIQAANREARARGLDNPIFTGADLIYDGVIIKKIPDLNKFIDGDGSGNAFDAVMGSNATSGDGLDNGGAAASRVGVGFLAGAQAIGFGIGRMPTFKRKKEDDYDHLNGVGIAMKHDIKKTFYNNKQHGVITHFYSATKDV